MRYGTWNLDARWDERHAAFLQEQDCDVWLLTEVPDRAALPGYEQHRSQGRMARGQAFATVLSRAGLAPLPGPHPAAAAAEINGVVVCGVVLPWRSSGVGDGFGGGRHAEKTQRVVDAVLQGLPDGDVVLGGDWNHSFAGPERVGSKEGREHVFRAMRALDMQVLTGGLPSRTPGVLSIDHVAVPRAWVGLPAEHVPAERDGAVLSDHDLYVVEAVPHSPS